jgi:hypothetical protein
MIFVLLISLFIGGDKKTDDFLKQKIANYGNWNSVKTIEFNLEGTITSKWQGFSYVNVSTYSRDLSYHFSFEDSVLYHATDTYFPGGYHFDFKFYAKDKKVTDFNPSGSRAGRYVRESGEGLYNRLMTDIPTFMPLFALKNLLGTPVTILNKNSFSTVNARGDSSVYSFNRDGVVNRIDNFRKGSENYTTLVYEAFTFVHGKWLSGKMSEYRNDNLAEVWVTKDLKFNNPFNENLIELPDGFKTEDLEKRALKLTMLSKRAHLLENISGSRNSLIYEFERGLLISDAPNNDNISKKTIELLTKKLNKPVTHVFLGHHHNDHIFGFTEFYKNGAKIIFNRKFYQAIIDHLNANDLKINNEQLIPFDGIYKMSEEVEFHSVEKGSHADGISFMYLPKEEFIYQGDFFTLPYDGFIIKPIQVTREFDEYLTDKMIEFKLIISHHAYSKIDKTLYEKIMNR